ncbi:MAG TPA: energy transducer TonB [Gemmatimonadaceae bacterium]|nr:energy transducer TonB [Gemmatimonadaceae bacterium]
MMRLWMNAYAKPPAVGTSVVLSTVVHALLISAAVAGTAGAPEALREAIASRVQFLPPPDQRIAQNGPSEVLRFIALPATGNMGFDPTPLNKGPSVAARVAKAGTGDAPISVPVTNAAKGDDSVLSVLEVDSTATRYPDSASPAYPPDLLAKNIQGTVSTEYIVDTSGFADTASLVIVSATNPGFSQAVREALPYMRFRAAKLGNRKVRQLVEQQFTFRITRPKPDTLIAKGPGKA